MKHYSWGIFPQGIFVVSPYKDPVEIHIMKKILDRLVTGFFVLSFGIIWFFSIRYHVKPNQYSIIVYDLLGKEFKLEGIRTSFKTKQVAISFLKEYKSCFPHYDFTIGEQIPEFKKRTIFALNRD